MLDALLILGGTAIWLYGLIDCARIDQDKVRNLPKWAWLLIIIFFGTLGAISWLIIGRPKGNSRERIRPARTIPPDDNQDFLNKL